MKVLNLIVAVMLLSLPCYAFVEPVSAAAAASTISPWALAGASALGAGISSAFNWFSARKSEQFSERMANTAHQREVQDLRAAGLNPILSAGGRGAPSPTGVNAQASNVDIASAMMAATQMQKTRAETRLIDVEADKAEDEWAQVAGSVERMLSIRAGMLDKMNQAGISSLQRTHWERQLDLIDNQIKLINAQAKSARAQAAKDEMTKKPYELGRDLYNFLVPSAKEGYNKSMDWMVDKLMEGPNKNAPKGNYMMRGR